MALSHLRLRDNLPRASSETAPRPFASHHGISETAEIPEAFTAEYHLLHSRLPGERNIPGDPE